MASRRNLVVLAILTAALVGTLLLLTTGPSANGPSRPDDVPVSATGQTETAPPPPPTVAGGVVEGRVVRRGVGTAAQVEARLADGLERGTVAGSTAAGTDGHFVLTGLGPGRYEVRATAADRTAGEAFAELPAAGVRVRVRIELPAGPHTIAGRAAWADGRPFQGLVRGSAWTETGPDGRFRIRGLERGTHDLSFLLPGIYRSRGHHVVVPDDREHVFIVDEGAVALEGRILDAESGEPVPDALVVAHGGESLFAVTSRHRVRTDPEGRFRVFVPLTYRSLSVSADGYRPCRYYCPEKTEKVEVALDRTYRATGRVETAEGAPVKGVVVHAFPASGQVQAPADRAVSGDDGRFRLDGIATEDVVIHAWGGGYVSMDLGVSLAGIRGPFARTFGRHDVGEIRLVVVRTASMEGRVTDAADRPVAGANVQARPLIGGHTSGLIQASLRGMGATGPDGRFRLTEILPCVPHHLWVRAPGHGTALVRVPAVPPGGNTDVEVVLSAGRSIRVLAFVAKTKEPVAGALIELETQGGPSLPIKASANTDAEGRVEFEGIVASHVVLRGKHPDHLVPGPGVRISGVPAGEVRLGFRPGSPIAGRVLFADGTPVPHGRVDSWPVPGNRHPGNRRTTLIGAGGKFQIRGHHPSRYRVEADTMRNGRRHVGFAMAEAGDEGVEIRLAPESESASENEPDGVMVRVLILDPEGRPVPYAELQCVEFDGRTSDTGRAGYLAYLGRATVELDADTEHFWLRVGGARTLSGKPLPVGPVVVGPLPAAAGERKIRLPPAREIRGLVLDGEGRAVPGANVGCVVLAEQGSVFDGPARTAYTDDAGRFRIGGLGEGEHSVSASRRGLGRAETTAPSDGGDVTLVLASGPTATVRVLDSRGRPVSGARVRLSGWTGSTGINTDADGRARFSDIRYGPPFSLLVRRTSSTPEASIDPWVPRDTTVRLQEARQIEGRVVDGEGKPLADVEVWCCPNGGSWVNTCSVKDGKFSFEGLPAGPAILISQPDDVQPSASDSRAITVPAGRASVRLVHRPGAVLRFRIRDWDDERAFSGPVLFTSSGKLVAECWGGDDGEFEIIGLDGQARYGLYVAPLNDGRTLFRTGLRPGTEPLVLNLEAGGTVRGTLVRRVPAEYASVWLEGPGFALDAALLPDGTFEILGVPSGAFTVIAEGRHDDQQVRAEVRASRGDTVKLILGGD